MSARLFGFTGMKVDAEDSNDESDVSFSGSHQAIRSDLP